MSENKYTDEHYKDDEYGIQETIATLRKEYSAAYAEALAADRKSHAPGWSSLMRMINSVCAMRIDHLWDVIDQAESGKLDVNKDDVAFLRFLAMSLPVIKDRLDGMCRAMTASNRRITEQCQGLIRDRINISMSMYGCDALKPNARRLEEAINSLPRVGWDADVHGPVCSETPASTEYHRRLVSRSLSENAVRIAPDKDAGATFYPPT